MARGCPRETAALRLLASWVYLTNPHYYTTRKSHFRRHFSCRWTLVENEDWGDRKKKKKERKRKRGDFYSPLSSQHSHFDVLRPFFFRRKMQIAIALLRNDDYGQMSGNFLNISIILLYLSYLRGINFLRWISRIKFIVLW